MSFRSVRWRRLAFLNRGMRVGLGQNLTEGLKEVRELALSVSGRGASPARCEVDVVDIREQQQEG